MWMTFEVTMTLGWGFKGHQHYSYMHQSVWIPRGGGQGQPRGFWQLSDIPPSGVWQWCSDPGALLTFKIKKFSPLGVGNKEDSDTKGADESVDFERRNVQMSESPRCAQKGPWWFTMCIAPSESQSWPQRSWCVYWTEVWIYVTLSVLSATIFLDVL